MYRHGNVSEENKKDIKLKVVARWRTSGECEETSELVWSFMVLRTKRWSWASKQGATAQKYYSDVPRGIE